MLKPQELFGLAHYDYGEAYFGSRGGKRFRLAREPLKDVRFIPVSERDPQERLLATVWPEPYSYADTDPSLMTSERFMPTEEGYLEAVKWINERTD